MGRTGLTCGLLPALVLAGCASRPRPEPYYEVARSRIERAAASVETNQPVTLPDEPYIAGPHDVGFYVSLALERNPEVLAAQRAVAAQAQVIPQVTSLDDPKLMDTFMPITSNSLQTAAGRAPNALSFSQKLPWLSKLRVRGEIAEQDAKIALTRLAQAQLKVTEEVQLAYFEVAFLQRAIEITREDADRLREIEQIVNARYISSQKKNLQDLLRTEVELSKLQNRLILLRRQLQQAQADLAATIHASADADIQAVSQTPIPDVPTEIDQLYEAAVRCRPELQERLHAVIKSQRASKLAELEYYPDFNVGIGWQSITTNNALVPVANGNDNIAFSIGVDVPVWRDRLRAGVRESEQRTIESSLRYDASRDDTFRMIRRLVVQVQTLDEQIRLYQESIIPRAGQTLTVSMSDYEVGTVDFEQMLDNWSELLTFQVQLARLEANLAQSLASLERTVGCQLATLPQSSPTEAPAESGDDGDMERPDEPATPPAAGSDEGVGGDADATHSMSMVARGLGGNLTPLAEHAGKHTNVAGDASPARSLGGVLRASFEDARQRSGESPR